MKYFRHLILCQLLVFSCAAPEQGSILKVRNLTTSEAMADFDELVSKVKSYYGPLRYKEQRFGFDFEQVAAKERASIASAKNDAEVFGAYKRLLANLKDIHVSIKFPTNSEHKSIKYKLPLEITPIENKAIIREIGDEIKGFGIDVGDELLTMDGQRPFDLLETVYRYESVSNEASKKHLLSRLVARPFYIPELTPQKAISILEIKKANGQVIKAQLIWKLIDEFENQKKEFVASSERNAFYSEAMAEFVKAGSSKPFFINEKSNNRFGFLEVKPNSESLKKYGIDPTKDTVPEIYAAIYRYEDKNILLVRQPTYKIDEFEIYIKTFKALFSQYEPLVDVLVLDQTHNPGGWIQYAQRFFSLFISTPQGALVQKFHADRLWIDNWKKWTLEDDPTLQSERSQARLMVAAEIEKSYDLGREMTDFLPFYGVSYLYPDEQYVWKKPMLLVVDEKSCSCGDVFPMLIKSNNVAKIFGEKTAGCGGNVDEVGALLNSNASLRLTRGLFSAFREDGNYSADAYIENNGVSTDYPYAHSVEDFRSGFVGYIEAFSKKALDQIKR